MSTRTSRRSLGWSTPLIVILLLTVPAVRIDAVSPFEREALLAIKDSINGAQSTKDWLLQDWGSLRPECKWRGVTCQGDTVVEIELSCGNCVLESTIPPKIAQLPNLRRLKMWGIGLSGPIPAEIGSLVKLEEVNFEANKLSGEIPSSMANLTNLETLRLGRVTERHWQGYLDGAYGNRLTGPIPPWLGNLKSLRTLGLGANQLSGPIPPELGQLGQLEVLDLAVNRLSGRIPPELGQLSRLKELSFGSNALTGPIPEALLGLHMPDLAALTLRYNGLYATSSRVANLAEGYDKGWAATQTVAPDTVLVSSVTATTVSLSWSPISYIEPFGEYEVWLESPHGEVFGGSIKRAQGNSLVVDDLVPETTYRVKVRSTTPAHKMNASLVTSDFSTAIESTTGSQDAWIAIVDGRVAEGDDGVTAAAFTVLRQATGVPATVQWSTSDGTARAQDDYEAVPPTDLTFGPSETSKTVTVAVRAELIDENDESFTVRIVSPTGGVIARDQATMTIVDDDVTELLVQDATVLEGSSGVHEAVVHLWLTNPSDRVVTVHWRTEAGTALEVLDFQAGEGGVSFSPGETMKTLRIRLRPDVLREPNEQFIVRIGPVVNAMSRDDLSEVTIVDALMGSPQTPDPQIVTDGCDLVDAPCTLSVRSESGQPKSQWVYTWVIDGEVRSTGATCQMTFRLPRTYNAVVKATSAAGTSSASTSLEVREPRSCGPDRVCLLDGRFDLSLLARDQRTGTTGTGLPSAMNDVFGYFSLPTLTGNPDNPEVFVKMLDGREVTGNFWVFFGGLTDLEYELNVRDNVAGTSRTYVKPGGSSGGGFDVGGGVSPETCPNEVDGLPVASVSPEPCDEAGDHLCLSGGRFETELTAFDPRSGAVGKGIRVEAEDLFGFFAIPDLTNDPENVEVFVKILDGRPVNGYFWVFYGGLTDLEYTITVTDTMTGTRKSYTKAAGSACGGFDVDAF